VCVCVCVSVCLSLCVCVCMCVCVYVPRIWRIGSLYAFLRSNGFILLCCPVLPFEDVSSSTALPFADGAMMRAAKASDAERRCPLLLKERGVFFIVTATQQLELCLVSATPQLIERERERERVRARVE
jgi:hypothetical protein